jgi:acyl carrier protein
LEELARLPEARRLAALSEWIREQVRGVLGLDTVGEVPLDQPLQELGLDSLMAVELRNIVRSRLALNASLPSTLVFDYPTVEALADHLGCDVLAVVGSEKDREDAHSTAGPEQSVESEIDDTLRGLEELSDEEVRLALRNRMSGES